MPTCNITTTAYAVCPPTSSVDIEIYATGTINGLSGGSTAGTLLASGSATDDTFTVTDALPQAWHITNATAVDIVSSFSGTYASFDIDRELLPEDIQICYTITDGCGTSNQVCDTALSCAPVPFAVSSYSGVPGTEIGEGTRTHTGGRVALFGAGPYINYRSYNVVFSNGITGTVSSTGTTSNQMFTMETRVDLPPDPTNPNINTYYRLSDSATSMTFAQNALSKWDNWTTEGAIVTWTFDQPVEKLEVRLVDMDGSWQSVADSITPEADAYYHISSSGATDGSGIATNANGIYRYRPTSQNNLMALFWDSPITTFSLRMNETANLTMNPTALHCEIPSYATFV